jgi:hypothetical protein
MAGLRNKRDVGYPVKLPQSLIPPANYPLLTIGPNKQWGGYIPIKKEHVCLSTHIAVLASLTCSSLYKLAGKTNGRDINRYL